MRPIPTSPPLGDTGHRTDSEKTATDAVLDVWTLERGELLSLSRLGCHTMGKREPSGIGPNLRDVYGREIGRYPGYLFSNALRAKTGHWNAAALDAYLKDPQDFAPGTSMEPILASREDRRILIDYFRTRAK